MFRFILRVLPIEVACYASEDEIAKAIEPLVARYFPVETQSSQKVFHLLVFLLLNYHSGVCPQGCTNCMSMCSYIQQVHSVEDMIELEEFRVWKRMGKEYGERTQLVEKDQDIDFLEERRREQRKRSR